MRTREADADRAGLREDAAAVPSAALRARLDWLNAAQNSDGGWAYRTGLQSWVEPTTWAVIAIAAADRSSRALLRGSAYIVSLQNQDGSWPACAGVPGGHWSTSLAISAGLRLQFPSPRLARAAGWLSEVCGSESGILPRLGALLDPGSVEFDRRLVGWNWTPGTSSWIEPTGHAVLALSAARRIFPSGQIDSRLASARRMLLDRRCSDGGWNYGNRRVLGTNLPGYAQTTAVALLALYGQNPTVLAPSLAFARRAYASADTGRLGRVWLALALARHGQDMHFAPDEAVSSQPADDVILNSLELLALAGGDAM